MRNVNGHPLHLIHFRSGRSAVTFQAFTADATAARAYFDRVIAPDWHASTGKIATFVAAEAA